MAVGIPIILLSLTMFGVAMLIVTIINSMQQIQQCAEQQPLIPYVFPSCNLHKAVAEANVLKVKCFLYLGADPQRLSFFGTPLQIACCNPDNNQLKEIEIMQLLISHGANVNCLGIHGATPLHNAVQNKCVEIVRFLLKNGAFINFTDQNRNTPLDLAKISKGADESCLKGQNSENYKEAATKVKVIYELLLQGKVFSPENFEDNKGNIENL